MRPRSFRRPAAVDGKIGPGDLRGGFRAQVERKRGDLFDGHELLGRLRRQARVAWNADERLMAMIWSHFSTGNSSIGATCWMPALFTRMSTDPSVVSAVLTIAAISSG